MRAIVDTNVIIAYLVRDDPNHSKAEKIISELDIILLPTVVVIELAYVFRKRGYNLGILSELISSQEVMLVEHTFDDFLFAFKENPKYYDDFNDLLILHTALRLDVNLETFDEGLKKKYEKLKSK